ncbi:unnamed protein product [Miscanthus lutarioriparius]|uniref:Uncharacterized protein n=1 Tax=Miscanthus lutarioriparius TaxID=422564 RepID=A0A811RIS9_9POAL|nr:unnamed protein product [Miscanthus lutarioriparius]
MVRRPTPVAVAASEPLLSPGAAPVTPCPYPLIYPPDPVPVPVRSSLAARFELAQVRLAGSDGLAFCSGRAESRNSGTLASTSISLWPQLFRSTVKDEQALEPHDLRRQPPRRHPGEGGGGSVLEGGGVPPPLAAAPVPGAALRCVAAATALVRSDLPRLATVLSASAARTYSTPSSTVVAPPRTALPPTRARQSGLDPRAWSNKEVKHLQGVNERLLKRIVVLKGTVKTLNSKIDPLTLDDSLNQFVEQCLGSEDVIYLVGGFDGFSFVPSLDSFSPSLDVVTPLKPMAVGKSYTSTVALEGKIFVLGGGDGVCWFDTVYCYDRSRGDWSTCPSLTRDRWSLAGVSVNGRIYAFGGGDGTECFSDVEMFDPTHGKWIKNQPMLEKRLTLAGVALNGVIYAVGGFNGVEYLSTTERLDPREPNWKMLPRMSAGRGCHTLTMLDEKIFSIGGYDTGLKQWWLLLRGYHSSAVLGGSIFTFGGVKGEADTILDVGQKVLIFFEDIQGPQCFSYVTMLHKPFYLRYSLTTILKKYSSTVATIFTVLASAAFLGHTLTINFLLGISVVFISMHQFFSPLAKVKDDKPADLIELEDTQIHRSSESSFVNMTAGAADDVG